MYSKFDMNDAQPWHQRAYDVFDETQYLNYKEMHLLTLSWLTEKNITSYELPRFKLPKLTVPQLPLHQKLTELIEEQSTKEKLAELEKKSWFIQKQVINALFHLTKPKSLGHLESHLKLKSWNHGRTCYQKRWDQEHTSDLKTLYQTLIYTPFILAGEKQNHIILRSTQNELIIELTNKHYQSKKAFEQNLFPFHLQWIKGFVYSLNPKIIIKLQVSPSNRFRLHFSL